MNKLIVLVVVTVATIGFGESKSKQVKTKRSAQQQTAAPKTNVPAEKAATVSAVPSAQPTVVPVTPAPVSPQPIESTPSSTVAVVSVPSESKIVGSIDLRPTYGSKTGEVHTENIAELGYQFDKNTSVSYGQWFYTNIYNSSSAGRVGSGLNLVADDGYLAGRINNIYKNTSGLSFSYHGLFYTPTNAIHRDSGMITYMRNYLVLNQDVNPTYSFTLMEIPVIHVWNKAGSFLPPTNLVGGTGVTGGEAANPAFENRLYVINTFNFTENLSLSVPIWLLSNRYADYKAGAKHNNAWNHKLMIYPEIAYKVLPSVALGLAYYSDALMTGDLAKFRIGAGLEEGATQVVLRASL